VVHMVHPVKLYLVFFGEKILMFFIHFLVD
jgi:hypothetical protein